MRIKILKVLLLSIFCFVLGYAAAQKITPAELRTRFVSLSPQKTQEQPQKTLPREKQLLTLRIEHGADAETTTQNGGVIAVSAAEGAKDAAVEGAASENSSPSRSAAKGGVSAVSSNVKIASQNGGIDAPPSSQGAESAAEKATASSLTVPAVPDSASSGTFVPASRDVEISYRDDAEVENTSVANSSPASLWAPEIASDVLETYNISHEGAASRTDAISSATNYATQNGGTGAVSALPGARGAAENISEGENSSSNSDAKVEVSSALPDRSASSSSLPKLALVIDDLGFSYEIAQRILALGVPVTWTIIPEAGQSRRTAALAEAHGIPYLVHISMQALADKKGSPEYVIGLDTSEKKMGDYLADLQKKFSAACGVSNHRGSRATSDIETMRRFMKQLAPTGWPFLDSRTIAKTVAPQAAREHGIPVLQNCTFIDGKPEQTAMKKQFEHALRVAREQGFAVAICHARETTLPFLKDLRENEFRVKFTTLDQLWENQEVKQ